MQAGSHVIVGLAAWSGAAALLGLPAGGPGAAVLAAAGALLPDIDHPRSWAGRRLRIISVPLSGIVGHRGVTHSLLAAAACLALLASHGWGGQAAPLMIGYLSHLLADACTAGGVPLLWPKRSHYGLKLFRTGSLGEYVTVGALGLGTARAWGWL